MSETLGIKFGCTQHPTGFDRSFSFSFLFYLVLFCFLCIYDFLFGVFCVHNLLVCFFTFSFSYSPPMRTLSDLGVGVGNLKNLKNLKKKKIFFLYFGDCICYFNWLCSLITFKC